MNWQPTAGSGLSRTVSNSDWPTGAYLTSYKYGPWYFTVDLPEEIRCFSIDELKEIIHKLEQLNERDTQNGRDTYRERAEVEVPQH